VLLRAFLPKMNKVEEVIDLCSSDENEIQDENEDKNENDKRNTFQFRPAFKNKSTAKLETNCTSASLDKSMVELETNCISASIDKSMADMETNSRYDQNENKNLCQNEIVSKSLVAKCWSCSVSLQDKRNSVDEEPFLYSTHSHPLFGISVCAACADRAYSIEQEARNLLRSNHKDSYEMDVCSLCCTGVDNIEPPDDDHVCFLDETKNISPICSSERSTHLFLCDYCPRAICSRCVCLSHGGGLLGLRVVGNLQKDDATWKCPACDTPPGLKQLQKDFDQYCSYSLPKKTVEQLIEELNTCEDAIDEAQRVLESDSLFEKKKEIKKELGSAKKEEIEMELELLQKKWSDHHNRLADTKTSIQEALEANGISLLAFYKTRDGQNSLTPLSPRERRVKMRSNSGFNVDHGYFDVEMNQEQKRAADLELDMRDKEQKFHGASGYSNKNSDVYKFEAKDLPPDVTEIEDILPLEEALTQMAEAASSKTLTEWRSNRIFPSREMIELALDEEDKYIEKVKKKTERKDRLKEKDEVKSNTNVNLQEFKMVEIVQRHKEKKCINRSDLKKLRKSPYKMATPKNKKRICLNHTPSPVVVEPEEEDLKPTPVSPNERLDSKLTLNCRNEREDFEVSDMILNTSEPAPTSKARITVTKSLASCLKIHQKEGVCFMWNNVCKSLDDITRNPPQRFRTSFMEESKILGCILAHHMGLGKSIQVISLLHTLFRNPFLDTSNARLKRTLESRIFDRVILCAPINTLTHWENEFTKWAELSDGLPITVHNLNSCSQTRTVLARRWMNHGGVLLTGFQSFRILCGKLHQQISDTSVRIHANKLRSIKKLHEALQEPDIFIIDEAHLALKSSTSEISKLMNSTRAIRRISLTGTPLQNNLREYYHMVNWVQPGLLGHTGQFEIRFEMPIMGGMSSDSSQEAIDRQTQANKNLHHITSPYIHRRDDSVLLSDLPPIQEAVLYIKQSTVQNALYKSNKKCNPSNNIFGLYSRLRPVFNHPGCLLIREFDNNGSIIENASSEVISVKDAPSEINVSSINERDVHWWKRIHKKYPNMSDWCYSYKIILLMRILAHADLLGDKTIVFSQSLDTLSFIESCLNQSKWEEKIQSLPQGKTWGPWRKNSEYLRLDGTTNSIERGELVENFNYNDVDSEGIENCKVILISVKAGGLGINLNSANRVILFDSHWNPTVDKQAFSRCYRYGQKKSVFVYRFLAKGTMEEKIYSRQVNKSGLSSRVIDLKHPERHFTESELSDLFKMDDWVECDNCKKWRMLPPGSDIENLPDKWYCEMNEGDKDRSNCSALEKNEKFYINFFSNRTNNNTEQGYINSPASVITEKKKKDNDKDKIDKDVILKSLLEDYGKSENDTLVTIGEGNRKAKSKWITKYHFHDTLLECSSEFTKSMTK